MTGENNVLLFLNLDCEIYANLLNRMSGLNAFHGRSSWLMFTKNFSRSLNLLKEQNINVDSKIFLVTLSENNVSQNVYHLKSSALMRKSPLIIELVGNYSLSHGLSYQTPFKHVNFTMNGIFLKVGVSVSFIII